MNATTTTKTSIQTPTETLRQERGHDLYPAGLLEEMPNIGETDGTGRIGEKTVHLRLFGFHGITYYLMEADGANEAWGYAINEDAPECGEFGYVRLSDLEQLTFKPTLENRELGLRAEGPERPVFERDCWFEPLSLEEALKADGFILTGIGCARISDYS